MDSRNSRQHPFREDMSFQRASWRAERIGWVVLGTVVFLAGLGLFSRGVLSHAVAHDPANVLRVAYERLLRHGSAMRITLQVSPADRAAAEFRIDLSDDFLTSFAVESVFPPPQDYSVTSDGVTLVYRFAEGQTATIQLTARPERIGFVRSAFTVDGTASVNLRQFVFP